MQIEMDGYYLEIALTSKSRGHDNIRAVLVQCWRKKDNQDFTLLGLMAEFISYS